MPKKLPYFPFYTGDWLKDDALTLCAPATRGVWIDLIARMHVRDRSGELCGTADQLARAARCSTVEFVHAATELQTTGTADVSERNGVYTIRNRRMYAESLERKSAAERQMRYRNAPRDGPNNGEKTKLSEYEDEDVFELFWKQYPKGRKNSKGTARDAFDRAICKASVDEIIAASIEYAASGVGRSKFVKSPSKWLDEECWNDDREAWRDKDKPTDQSAYEQVTAHQFSGWVFDKNFKDGPHRHGTQPNCMYGTLRDGRKVECKDIKK